MAVAYILLLLLALAGAGFRSRGFREDFLGREQCSAIKGISILAIFVSHVLIFLAGKGYSADRFLDALAIRIQDGLSQLVVVMFLFYSGYGVMESIKTRGDGYLEAFPRKRILATLLNFDVAVLAFIALGFALGTKISPLHAGLALVGWKSVGIPNWYIFVILCCYAATHAAFRLFPGRRAAAAWLVLVAVLAIQQALSVLKGGQYWWYDTILCYPAGVLHSLYKEPVVAFSRRHYWSVLGLLALAFSFLAWRPSLPEFRGLAGNLEAVAFALLVVQATMKLAIGNRVLDWFGRNVFPIYIYHRLPMLAIGGLAGDAWIVAHPYPFTVLCFAATCAIAHFSRHWRIGL